MDKISVFRVEEQAKKITSKSLLEAYVLYLHLSMVGLGGFYFPFFHYNYFIFSDSI
jgi:hypothetical protein